MKKPLLLALIFFAISSVSAQLRLNVAGDASISGKLGVGVLTPADQLEVLANGASATRILVTNLGGGNATLRARTTPSDYGWFAVGGFNGFQLWDFNAGTSRIIVDGSGNVGIGSETPGAKLDVFGNARIGGRLHLDAGDANIFIGNNAGINNTGTSNTFLGFTAGVANTSGFANTFIGRDAGESNGSGQRNTFVGEQAGSLNTTGSENTFIGENAGLNNLTANANTFVGRTAGSANTIGNRNTFLGNSAGQTNVSGSDNTMIGYHSGRRIGTNRSGNVFVGDSTGVFNQRDGNVFVGSKAGKVNAAGTENTFIGHLAGTDNTSGKENTFVGDDAGENTTTPEDDTFIGQDAGQANTIGTNNTFLGQAAGFSNTTGSQNTYVGDDTGNLNTTGDNNTLIGQGSNLTASNISNAFAIGTNTLVNRSDAGIIGNISTQDVRAYVNLATPSDSRVKKAEREDIVGLPFIMALRPISYQVDALKLDQLLRDPVQKAYREFSAEDREELENDNGNGMAVYRQALKKKSGIRYNGFIAQEVEKAAAEADFAFSGLVQPANKQDHYTLRYAEFVVPLVKGMQEQQEVIEEQQTEITALRSEVAALKTLVLQLLAQSPNQTPVQQLDLNRPAGLFQNHPNPFHENTVINYFLPEGAGKARLEVYSVDGKLLSTLPLPQSGEGQVQLKAGRFPAGTYLYSLVIDNKVLDTKRMVLLP